MRKQPINRTPHAFRSSLQLLKISGQWFLVLVGAAALFAAGCASTDLVVTRWETTGPATVDGSNHAVVPVRVVVRNQGTAAAGKFKVCTNYQGTQGNFAVAFTVPGQTDIWYPYTSSPLSGGDEVTFAGNLTFHPSVHNETVTVKATADCCSGDEFMPDYCRVQESDETNNDSPNISVALP